MKPRNTTRKRPTIGVKWKLFGSFVALAVVILGILWLCQVVFLDDIYRFIKTAEIRSAAQSLSAIIDDSDALTTNAEDISRRNDVCLLILRMDGPNRAVRLASCEAEKNCVIHNMADQGIFTLYDSAQKNQGRLLQHFRYDATQKRYLSITAGNNGGDPESIIYSLLVENSRGQHVLLILNSVISPVEATVKTLHILLIAVSLLMLCLALLLAAILSRSISRPMVEISSAAKVLAQGTYDVHFQGGSYREIQELSDTLNYAAEELAKVDSLRRELIANISHDLRTPLTMIAGYAEVMRDLSGENTPENAQIILDESRRLTSLVNDMLDISKLESNNQPITPETFSITTALRESMERYHHFRTREGYHLSFLADRDITVTTDRSKFLQAFCNLVNNAITYTGTDKQVTVTQEPYRDDAERLWVRIAVTDTGDGIPEDKLALIWDRYYKIDAAHKRAAQGTGLGLSIVHKILSLLGGRCGVVSKVGVGSTFWIEIPAIEEAQPAPSENPIP